MAANTILCLKLNSNAGRPSLVDSSLRKLSESSLLGYSINQKSWGSMISKRNTARTSSLSPRSYPISASYSFDVVIVGAGIIGLTIARQFLLESNLSVAVIDKAVPCSGATGAGQGYIWLVHETPDSDTWQLKLRSRNLWKMFAETIQNEGMSPLQVMGWKETGSLLIGRTPEETTMLKRRVQLLTEAGVEAKYLSSSDLLLEEPALTVGEGGCAAYVPDDFQFDAQRTVAFIEKANRRFGSIGRYAEFYYDPAISLLRSGSSRKVGGVQTLKNTIYSNKAVVIAAGCWSGTLMHDLMRESEILPDVPVKPRKGHLLVVENFNSFRLNHGLMEAGYVDHKAASQHSSLSTSGLVNHDNTLSISMTATMDTMGNLVLGSSRQFCGFNTRVDESIIDRIWKRAGDFFPPMRELSLADFSESRKVRIGLRPYMADGKPVIGSIPGLSNIFLATGHEGGGLCMALGTAEMVANLVLGKPGNFDYTPFAIQGRGL